MIHKNFKSGIAMIELIFAIVIIGIVLLSSPMLIQQSINSSFVSMQQEAIAAASSQTAVLLSKPWDEKDATNIANSAPIITLTNGNASALRGLNGLTSSDNARIAVIASVDTTASIMGRDFNETVANASTNFDDIDDYHGQVMGVTVFNNEGTTASVGDYVDVDLIITNSITYADDTPSGLIAWSTGDTVNAGDTIFKNQTLGVGGGADVQSHIKFVQVNLTSANPTGTDELVKNITLSAFSCNIGTYPMGDSEDDFN
ncbi:MAG: hypothetical protein KAG56_07430 [Sulfurovaceae bacterium]|nr:hypothetical protein [Sulfurovaceae bacterium]